MNSLLDFGIIPIDYTSLRSIYPAHKSLNDKISDLEKQGTIIRLKRGMYVVSPHVSKKIISTELIANHLYGLSYVSMESALRLATYRVLRIITPLEFRQSFKRITLF